MSFWGGHDFKVGFGRMKNVNKVLEGYPGGGYITLVVGFRVSESC